MANKIKVSFDKGLNGVLENKRGKTNISFDGSALAPYDLFLGGFASCLHATFKGIAEKKRILFESVSYEVVGIKREEVPTYLEEVIIKIEMTGVEKSKEKAIEKSMSLAERYCSISALINQVAEMKLEIIFK